MSTTAPIDAAEIKGTAMSKTWLETELGDLLNADYVVRVFEQDQKVWAEIRDVHPSVIIEPVELRKNSMADLRAALRHQVIT